MITELQGDIGNCPGTSLFAPRAPFAVAPRDGDAVARRQNRTASYLGCLLIYILIWSDSGQN